jgi:hypothetical protein
LLSVLGTGNTEPNMSLVTDFLQSNNNAQNAKNINFAESSNIESSFIKILEKKLLANIYMHIMERLLNSANHLKIFEELDMDKLVRSFRSNKSTSASDESVGNTSSNSNITNGSENHDTKLLNRKRNIKTITDCPHVDRKHYAKVLILS